MAVQRTNTQSPGLKTGHGLCETQKVALSEIFPQPPSQPLVGISRVAR